MRPLPPPSDEELLTSHDPEAFGLLYDRYVREFLGYFMRRTGDAELAADLTAETFASALVSKRRYVSGKGRPSPGCSRSRRAGWPITGATGASSAACSARCRSSGRR